MFIAAHEWSQPALCPGLGSADLTRQLNPEPGGPGSKSLYDRLCAGLPDDRTRAEAAAFLQRQLAYVDALECELPDTPDDLMDWMDRNTQLVTAKYALYLERRKSGAPRRYFASRAHALAFVRAVAPTKLVDGAWLYGVLAHWRNTRFDDLVRTYVEELGEGAADKNHVVLYRRLLSRYGLDGLDDLDDRLYLQGTIQLALGWNAPEFLPEVIGFNLGYEQLPLHLLITAYELNELGLDPYYFTLHVTVDNAGTGHARRACQAVLDTLPRLGDPARFWQRVRAGSKLGAAGAGTVEIIEGFDIDDEVVRIFSRKSTAGRGAHSDYCRVAGRSINDWLSQPESIPSFLQAMQQAGWIKRGQPVEQSRFWGLLQGERAEMFGVFTSYELQVIHDWIRGAASSDGQPYAELAAPASATRRPSFRAASRSPVSVIAEADDVALLDPDLQALAEQLPQLNQPDQLRLLVGLMSPSLHWTPAGLRATRLFWEQSRC